MKTIHGENYTIKLNEETGILHSTYRDVVNGKTTARLYMDGAKIVREYGVEKIQGMIIDFRTVERFERDNLASTQRESYNLNAKMSIDHIPVALIVQTPLQEQTLRISIRATPDQHRKKIVHSEDEALQFIDAWHQQRNKTNTETSS